MSSHAAIRMGSLVRLSDWSRMIIVSLPFVFLPGYGGEASVLNIMSGWYWTAQPGLFPSNDRPGCAIRHPDLVLFLSWLARGLPVLEPRPIVPSPLGGFCLCGSPLAGKSPGNCGCCRRSRARCTRCRGLSLPAWVQLLSSRPKVTRPRGRVRSLRRPSPGRVETVAPVGPLCLSGSDCTVPLQLRRRVDEVGDGVGACRVDGPDPAGVLHSRRGVRFRVGGGLCVLDVHQQGVLPQGGPPAQDLVASDAVVAGGVPSQGYGATAPGWSGPPGCGHRQ